MAVSSIDEYRERRQEVALDRLPPHSIEAEQAVLGSILMDRDAITVAGEVVEASDFSRDAHRAIFEAALRLRARGEPSDIVTITDELEKADQLAACGGVPYIHSLSTVVPTAVHTAHYAAIVREASQKRRLIGLMGRGAALGYAGDTTAAEAVAQVSGDLRSLLDQRGQRGGHISTIRVPREFLEQPIATPFSRLSDLLNGGFRPGVSYVVAAPPGGLKTSFLVEVAIQALRSDYGVCYVTNELPAYVMRERFLANMGGYSFQRALKGEMGQWELDHRESATAVLEQMPLYMWESVSSAEEIGLRLANTKARAPEAKGWMIVLDYIQRLDNDARMDLHRAISRNFDRLQTISRNESAALVMASSLSKGERMLEPDEWGGKDSGDVLGYTSVFLGLKRHKERDYQGQDRAWNLGLTGWLVKNTLGMTTQVDYTVHGPSQKWTEAAA